MWRLVGPGAPVSVLRASGYGDCRAGRPPGLLAAGEAPPGWGCSAPCGVWGVGHVPSFVCGDGRQWPHQPPLRITPPAGQCRPLGSRARGPAPLSSPGADPRPGAPRHKHAQGDPFHALTSHTTAHSRTTATPAPPRTGHHTHHQPPRTRFPRTSKHTRTGKRRTGSGNQGRQPPRREPERTKGSRGGGRRSGDGCRGVRVRTSLRRGRSGSGMAGGAIRGCGSIVARERASIPTAIDPGKPSSHGPRRQGRSYSSALHLDALNRDCSTNVWVEGRRDGNRGKAEWEKKAAGRVQAKWPVSPVHSKHKSNDLAPQPTSTIPHYTRTLLPDFVTPTECVAVWNLRKAAEVSNPNAHLDK